MIGLIGIFVITSSACVRVSPSSTTIHGEISRPVCEWINHNWIDKVTNDGYFKIFEYQQCNYCDKKRIRKESWEYIK